jgi:Tfp pilus assembly protein FimT
MSAWSVLTDVRLWHSHILVGYDLLEWLGGFDAGLSVPRTKPTKVHISAPGHDRAKPARSGHTLIELFVVVIIVALIATGLTMMGNRGSASAAQEAAERFKASFQEARGEAIAQGRWALVVIQVSPAADSAAGRSAQYTAAVVNDPNMNTATFAQAAWTPVNENIVLDPGAARTGPLPGTGAEGGYSRSSFSCRTTCDMGGASAVTVFFRPADDSTAVWAVLVSQSGQSKVFKYAPAGSGVTPWQ